MNPLSVSYLWECEGQECVSVLCWDLRQSAVSNWKGAGINEESWGLNSPCKNRQSGQGCVFSITTVIKFTDAKEEHLSPVFFLLESY